MRKRLLATGLGAAVLVAGVTFLVHPAGRGGGSPDMASPSMGEGSPSEAVVPPEPPPARRPAGPASPRSGVARFRGSVETRGGSPAVPGTRIRLLTSPQDELLALGSLRPDGTFEIEAGLPPARLPLIVRLEVDRDGWVPCGPLPGVHLVGTLPFEREGVRLAIAPGTEVRGRVTTVRGAPPPLPVRIVQPSEDSPGTITGLFLRATTDGEGSFRASIPSTEAPVLLVQADGYLTVAEEWDSASGEQVEIALPRAEDLLHVTGRVVRGDGRTSEAAQVTGRLLSPSPLALPRWIDRALAQRDRYLRTRGEEATATQANGMGFYSLSLPSPGTWLLEFRGEIGATERRVHVGRLGSIRCDAVLEGDTFFLSGSVTDRSTGAPVPDAAIRLGLGREAYDRHGKMSSPNCSGRTNEEGEFRLGPLLRGEEKGDLEVEARGYVVRPEELVFADLGSPPRIAVSVVRECRLLGRVVCEDGRPLSEAWVDADPGSIRTGSVCGFRDARTNAEGSFVLGGLSPGVDIRLRARTRPSIRDPCSEASAPFPVEQARETVTVVFFRGPGETIDVGDLVLSEVVSSFPGKDEAGWIPKVLPAPVVIPR